jgi:hypothetical protein
MIWFQVKSSDGMVHWWIVMPGMAEINLERTIDELLGKLMIGWLA